MDMRAYDAVASGDRATMRAVARELFPGWFSTIRLHWAAAQQNERFRREHAAEFRELEEMLSRNPHPDTQP